MRFSPPAESTTAYRIAHRLLWLLLPMLCRLRVEGREHLPREGGCVLASNHSFGFDFFFLGYTASRQIFYMAKAEALSGNRLLGDFLRSAGVFPIQRGQRDLAALDNAVSLVQSGRVVGMFPEGTRSKTGVLRRGRSGAVRIAQAANAPICPVAVHNANALLKTWWNPFRRPVVTIRYGDPLTVRSHDTTDTSAEVSRMMRAIASLLPYEFRGEYAISD